MVQHSLTYQNVSSPWPYCQMRHWRGQIIVSIPMLGVRANLRVSALWTRNRYPGVQKEEAFKGKRLINFSPYVTLLESLSDSRYIYYQYSQIIYTAVLFECCVEINNCKKPRMGTLNQYVFICVVGTFKREGFIPNQYCGGRAKKH